jgi:hypothetical protein
MIKNKQKKNGLALWVWMLRSLSGMKPGHDESKKGSNAGKEMNCHGAVEVPEGLTLCE